MMTSSILSEKYNMRGISYTNKINVVACLDRFLAQLVLRLPYLGG